MQNHDTGTAPPGELILSASESEHCTRVTSHIAAQIDAAGGWIGFDRYMDLALYAPGIGYYSAGARKMAAGGDYTTAPEVSRLFGRCIAAQCAKVLDAFDEASILEIGAGTGRLAVDILMCLEERASLPDRYLILEISADLRERQRRLIERSVPHLLHRVAWLNAPPATRFDGVILGNEVLDALPVRRFRWIAREIQELGVVNSQRGFAWNARTADPAFAATCGAIAAAAGSDWRQPYVSEVCTFLPEWARGLTRSLDAGAVFWFDYGLPRRAYYLAERDMGTLNCRFRHRSFSDPFLHPGLQDISAWVDFTLIAEIGASLNFEIAAFTNQALFLAASGIDREIRVLAGTDRPAYAQLADEAKTLMLPGQMGESFKLMAWTRNFDASGLNLALRDLRDSL